MKVLVEQPKGFAPACFDAANGDPWLALDLALNVRQMVARRSLVGSRPVLLLQEVANGASISVAARRLSVHPETAKDDLTGLRRELGARNLAHAVALAWRQGLIK